MFHENGFRSLPEPKQSCEENRWCCCKLERAKTYLGMFEGLGSSIEIFEWLLGQIVNPEILEHGEAQDEIVQREFPNGEKLGDVCFADIKGWYKRTTLKANGKKLHIYVGIAAPCKGYLPKGKEKFLLVFSMKSLA